MNIFRYLILIFIVLQLWRCAQPEKDYTTDRIVIRLDQEPNRLNPILATTGYETEIHEYVFVSLADYHPATLELVPVLLVDLPSAANIEMGPFEGGTRYEMEILPDAIWNNGSPITGFDVEFTLKLVNHPGINCPAWKALLNDIQAVEVDEQNPKSFAIITSGNYFLNKEAFLSAEIFPAYFYDSDDLLSSYSLSDIKDQNTADSLMNNNEEFARMASDFSSIAFSKESVEGAGPYNLKAWESGQFIILERKEDYWGKNYADRSFLTANPEQIIFQIITDNTTAITQLKNGQIDVISLAKTQYQSYNDLKNDSLFNAKFTFNTPDITQFYYVMMNNEDPRLKERAVRQALNGLVDVDRMMDLLEGGYARRVNSIVHPSKAEYNEDLPDYQFDVDKAISSLEEAGWVDTDGNGIRDKIINNRREQLSLRFFITGSNLSESISNILKESAALAGIEIDVVTKGFRNTVQENLLPGDYELTTMRSTQPASALDPTPYWHSSSIGSGGRNMARYANEEADILIETITATFDEEERRKAYMILQNLVYDDCPVIFLYAPVERMVISKKFDPVLSSKRPGYFANAFKPRA